MTNKKEKEKILNPLQRLINSFKRSSHTEREKFSLLMLKSMILVEIPILKIHLPQSLMKEFSLVILQGQFNS